MELGMEMADTFALMPAHWKVQKARQFLAHLQFTHCIVKRQIDGSTSYYLYREIEMRRRLDETNDSETLLITFNLDKERPTAAYDIHSEAEHVPDRAVVLDGDTVVG